MRSYTSHKNVIRFMRTMADVPRAICIYPSLVLSEVCREIGFCQPIYSEIIEERFMFEFTVKFRREGCSGSGVVNEVECNGYPFREKADAVESAALSGLENLLYCHGIRSGQYNDIVYCEYWPLFRHLSENIKGTKGTVMRVLDETLSLCRFVDDGRSLFESRRSEFADSSDSSDEIVMLDECESQLRAIHDTLLAESQQYRNNFRWHCQPNRPSNHDYYEGSYRFKKKMGMKVSCNSTIKLTLEKLCEATCYSAGDLSCICNREGSYVAEITIINPGDPDDHQHVRLSSGECPTVSEAEHAVIYRTIWFLCRKEGYKIIDPGYNDFSNLQTDSRYLRSELPTLCEMLVKLKTILHRGFSRAEILGHKYYRALRRQRLLSELRVPISDCISEFAYICNLVDEELGKVETYSANLPIPCSMSGVM